MWNYEFINYLSYEAKELFILGLEEKFQESLCILEILYGNLYKFHWSQDSNSHNHNSNFNYTKVTVSEYSRYSNNKNLYKKWLENNEAILIDVREPSEHEAEKI